jgi:hypothetical protein
VLSAFILERDARVLVRTPRATALVNGVSAAKSDRADRALGYVIRGR